MRRDPDSAALSAGDLIRIGVFGCIAIALCYAVAMYAGYLYSSISTKAAVLKVPGWFSFVLVYFFLLLFALLSLPLLVRAIPRVANGPWRTWPVWLFALLFFAIPPVCGIATSIVLAQIPLAIGYNYCTTQSSTGAQGMTLSTDFYTKSGPDDVCPKLLSTASTIPPDLAPFFDSSQPSN